MSQMTTFAAKSKI